MNYSKNGLALTESFEGCRLKAYQDSNGVWTIGYGHTQGVRKGMACTQAQAEAWLLQDVAWATKTVNAVVKVQLTQSEFDALTDFVFNVGSGNFEKSLLLHALNLEEYDIAANEFERWDKAGGKVVAGLLRRRVAERLLFITR